MSIDAAAHEPRGNSKIRFAAACARATTRTSSSSNSSRGRTAGGVVLAFSNPTEDATMIAIPGGAVTPRREWFLTSGGKGSGTDWLLSRVMLLNGVPLNHSSLKPGGMEGQPVPPSGAGAVGIEVPAWSYGFIVLEHARWRAVPGCAS